MKNRSEEVLKRAFNSQQQGSVVHQSRSEVPRQNSPTNGSLKATYLSTVLRMYFVEGLGYHTLGKLIPVSVSQSRVGSVILQSNIIQNQKLWNPLSA